MQIFYMMFAALHIPDSSAAALLRHRPEWGEMPCAVLAVSAVDDEGGKGKLPIHAVNPAARFAGIAAGWKLNRALVRCPDLRVLLREPAAEADLLADLVAMGESLTPDLEITAGDTLTLDLSGRRGDLEEGFSSMELSNVELWHALAATPDLAALAARCRQTCGRQISPADLAPLPLGLLHTLAGKSQALRLLDLWGLKNLGEFMKLPRQALTDRLGPEAGGWHDILHAKSCRLLRLHRPPESLAQRVDLEDVIEDLDFLVFQLKRMLHTLSGRLASRHLAVATLELRLILEHGGSVPRRIRLPEPQHTVEGMLAPLQIWLDSLQLDDAVCAVELDAETTFATAVQREWYGRQLPEPARWAETLAKLEALLGPGRVGYPVPLASHAPDAFRMVAAADMPPVVAGAAAKPACPFPLHRYRPARAIAVNHEIRASLPHPVELLNGPFPGKVIDCRGPFPFSGSWWDMQASWNRLEWDIQLESRHLLRLVLRPPDHWELDGIYA
jgi:protein ImuB